MSVIGEIIIPFLPAVSTQKFIPGGQKPSDPIRLQIGRSGQGKTFNGSASSTTSYYMDAAENEIKTFS